MHEQERSIKETGKVVPDQNERVDLQFLAYRIRISACFTWTDNSYLTHVI